MKKISIFCTGPLMYLTELPVLYLLYLSIKHNGGVETPFKLYPLIIALIGLAVFMFVYLYRVISISYDTVKITGHYSSKDKAVINEGKTLVLTLLPKSKIKVELFGCDEPLPELDWAKNEERENIEINLFRERAFGGEGSVRRVLRFFEISDDDIEAALKNETFDKSYNTIDLSAGIENECKQIRIKFNETL